MCGLTGIVDTDRSLPHGELQTTARRMASMLRHRGPDDEAVWVDAAEGVALGYRRLSIIDLSVEGRQPMVSADRRYVAVYNGEVYNHPLLRDQLGGLGHRFRGHSDTEVLLAAVVEWGVERAVERFAGMFALAIWDRESRALSLVRDRLGVKPLYYGWMGSRFLFASEIRSFRCCSGFPAEVDRDALALYFRLGYVPSPYSIYQGIRKLRAGTILRVAAHGRSEDLEPIPYWSARGAAEDGCRAERDVPEEAVIEELEARLRQAVSECLISDVPLGAFLSGGIDSSTVVALMQAATARPVKTFTIGFSDRRYDESGQAGEVAAVLGTDHTELIVTARDAQDVIPLLPSIYDEPFADSSQIPTFLISRLARESVTVALSGDGGDELFGGYNRHVRGASLWSRTTRFPRWGRRLAARALTAAGPRTWDTILERASALSAQDSYGQVMKLTRLLEAESPEDLYVELTSLWRRPADVVIGGTEPPIGAVDRCQRADLPDLARWMMCLDAQMYLPDDILTKVDRASMAVGLEVRVPLLDHRLFEYAWRIPLELKIRGGLGKVVLRCVLERYVPPRIFEKPKMGFGIPLGDWLRKDLRGWAEDLLAEKRIVSDGFLRPEPIRDAWEEHLLGNRDRHHELWVALMFNAWLEEQR
ncbi:asparagine synthase (glutamine-hydrolyzing) [soil metagenome]